MELKKYKDYIVSSDGKVYSKRNLKRMTTSLNYKGYEQIYLFNDNKKTTTFVHRLVALCFVDNPENKPQINHIDGNKLNNVYSNLEWVTDKENQEHAFVNGLKERKKVILNNSLTFDSISDCAKYLNTSQYSVSRVCSGKRKTLFGNIIEYCD